MDGDCNHEIKRYLLFRGWGGEENYITNLESILKNREITLLKKFHIVKDVVFPVVMYGCKSWTVKKAECQRINAFEWWC